MNITIDKAEQLPTQIQELAKQAQKEGFQFVDRLIEEYESGKNRFNQPGEFLLFVYDDEKLIACGGLNQQWNENEIDNRIGRVRRFYVLPKYRKHGVGKQLLQHLEKNARANFSALCLNTDTKSAAHFYQKQNYVFVENHPNYSYFKYLLQYSITLGCDAAEFYLDAEQYHDHIFVECFGSNVNCSNVFF